MLMAIWTRPVKKHRITAYVGSPLTGDEPNVAVMSDMMADGPSVMSLADPNTM